MTDNELVREKWDRRHAEAEGLGEPLRALTENLHLLPARGDALDLACGRGASALLLARRGLRVVAWDLSEVAIGLLRAAAEAEGLMLRADARDVVACPPEPNSFDLLVVGHFLERSLAPRLEAALRPGGLLVYQTFAATRITGLGPDRPDFRLADNELLTLFPGLKVRVYREEAIVGNLQRGMRDLAYLLAERTAVAPDSG